MQTVETYYDQNVEKEWGRLDRHPLEFEITKRYLDQYLAPQSNILDVGGGPGKYAFYLKSRGHRVCLADLSAENIRFAQGKGKELHLELDGYHHANALDLSLFADASFDGVLCLGPLYHLMNREKQFQAIRECLRVLKTQGIFFVAFITKFAQLVSLVNRSPEKIGKCQTYFNQVIETGMNTGTVDTEFTDSFMIDPCEIEPWMAQFALEKLIVSGVEGLFAQSEEKLKQLEQADLQAWLDLTFKYAAHPATLGACQHVLYVGRKQSVFVP